MIERFNIPLSTSKGANIFAEVLIVVGVVLLISCILLYTGFKDRQVFGGKTMNGIGVNSKYGLAILGVVMIVIGGCVCITTLSHSIVTIGDGYINVKSSDNFIGAFFTGNVNKNVTSEEIVVAFVGQVGSGDFKLHKQYGINFADANLGRFTLGNGAIAYVVSTNSTSLIVELVNGEYIIVGSSDTQTIAGSFSRNVQSLQT